MVADFFVLALSQVGARSRSHKCPTVLTIPSDLAKDTRLEPRFLEHNKLTNIRKTIVTEHHRPLANMPSCPVKQDDVRRE